MSDEDKQEPKAPLLDLNKRKPDLLLKKKEARFKKMQKAFRKALDIDGTKKNKKSKTGRNKSKNK